MTSEQISLVRASWPRIAANTEALTTAFYGRLFDIDDGAARLFSGVDMTAQRTKFAQSLSVLVTALDNLDELLPSLAALAKRHAAYGIEDRHFDSVGDALVWALSDAMGDAFTPELRAGWTAIYAIVASVMRRAIARETLPVSSRRGASRA